MKRNRMIRFIFLVTTVIILSITILKIHASWTNDANLNHVSGAWITLAMDLKTGVFYRPLYSNLGYGGTRFFPLFFSLHAGLIEIGKDPIITGYILSLSGMILLIGGIFFTLRNFGVDKTLACFSAMIVLVGASAQHSILAIRGDILSAALNVWGVGLCVSHSVKRRNIAIASLFFTLAFAAKITTIFGVVAVFVFFMVNSRTKDALYLLFTTVTGFFIVLGLMYIGSSGRIFEIFKVCASGGATYGNIFKSPLRLMATLYLDSGCLLFFLLGLAAFISLPFKLKADLCPLFFLATLLITTMIYGSPGTGFNHLLDLHVASILIFTTWISTEGNNNHAFSLATLILATYIAIFQLGKTYIREDITLANQRFKKVINFIGKNNLNSPLLAENPLLPIFAGEHPYLLDSFMLRIIRTNNSDIESTFWRELREKKFSAVVLEKNPNTKEGKQWYNEKHFGEGFIEKLEENYYFRKNIDDQFIYLPLLR